MKHLLLGSGLLVSMGCAAQGWQGAEAEKAYDKQLEAQRLAADSSNDDYYEIRAEGRVFVISDAKDYAEYKRSGEIPLRVTKIGGARNGETVVFNLTKKEAKTMEKKVGFVGGAQNLYEGKVQGAGKGFYGQVETEDRFYVFNDWKQLDAFSKTGRISPARTMPGPGGKEVVFAQADEATVSRFQSLHASN